MTMPRQMPPRGEGAGGMPGDGGPPAGANQPGGAGSRGGEDGRRDGAPRGGDGGP